MFLLDELGGQTTIPIHMEFGTMFILLPLPEMGESLNWKIGELHIEDTLIWQATHPIEFKHSHYMGHKEFRVTFDPDSVRKFSLKEAMCLRWEGAPSVLKLWKV